MKVPAARKYNPQIKIIHYTRYISNGRHYRSVAGYAYIGFLRHVGATRGYFIEFVSKMSLEEAVYILKHGYVQQGPNDFWYMKV